MPRKSSDQRFYFRIAELGRFLGKRPVTLRGWERANLVHFPRNERGERIFTTEDIRNVAATAYSRGRIDNSRYNLVQAAMTMLELLEKEND